jgi:hypothetical protein
MSKPVPPGPPAPHVLAGELARVRVAGARAKDDLAEDRMPDLADLRSLVAGVCATALRSAEPGAAQDPAQASALEALLAELELLEDEVRRFRDRLAAAQK